MNTLQLIQYELEKLNDFDWVLDNRPDLTKRDYITSSMGVDDYDYLYADTLLERLDFLGILESKYDSGDIEYKELVLAYDCGGEPLAAPDYFKFKEVTNV